MEGYITQVAFRVREYRNFSTIGIANTKILRNLEGTLYVFDSCNHSNNITDLNWIGFVIKNENCSLIDEIQKVSKAGALAVLYSSDDWISDIFNLPDLNIGIDDATLGFVQTHDVLSIDIFPNIYSELMKNFTAVAVYGFLALFIGFFIGKLYHIFITKYIQYKKRTKYLKLTKYVKRITSDDESCTICLDTFQHSEKIRTLICNHIFHEKCIDEWIKKTERCPNCNQNIYDGENTPLLFGSSP
jgi:hypothetical protein